MAESVPDARGPSDNGQPPVDGGQALPGWIETTGASELTFGCGGVTLRVTVLEAGIARLRYAAAEPFAPDHSYAVVDTEWPEVALQVSALDDGARAVVETGLLRLEIEQAGCRILVTDSEGRVLLEDPEGGGFASDPDGKRSVTRVAAPGEGFYGFGEKTGPLDKRGTSMVFRTSDPLAGGDYETTTDPIYQAIPFFVGMRGTAAYGVFTDVTWRMFFDMGEADPSRYRIEADGGELDQYLFVGPEVSEVVRRYTALTGRMTMPPRWTLGYHQCRWSYTPDTRVLEVAQGFRDHALPADGMWLDIDYMDGFRSFTFHPTHFSDPSALVADLEGIGFKTTVIIDPGIKYDPGWDVYDSGLAGGHFLMTADGEPFVGVVWPGDSVFPDFSSAAARQWWASLVPKVTAHGVRGLWIDMNEPASFLPTDGHTVPDSLAADGDGYPTTMAEVHNVYALNMARATRAGLEQAAPNRRPFVLTRAGYAGEQRYTAMWLGDTPSTWPMVRQVIPMMLGIGLSGVAFNGSDVGGFSGKATPELFARWMQVGSFSPFYRGHVMTGAPNQEPWEHGLEVEDISRAVLQDRYQRLPYLYSLMNEAATTGAPILRPMLYEHQGDPAAHAIEDQVMLGPWLLLAPVVEEGAESRSIYLPAGRWFEYFSGAVLEGPTTIEPPLTLGALPTYVREGAILPGGPVMQWSDEKPVSPLTLDLYPSAAVTRFSLYEDDGDTPAYEQGVFARVEYTLQRTSGGATLTAGPRAGSWAVPARSVEIRVRRVQSAPTGVTLDGAALPAAGGAEAIGPGASGWWYDAADLSLRVVMPDADDFTLQMAYDTAVAAAPTVLMSFEVAVPGDTPADAVIHLAGSFDGWSVHHPLSWSPGAPKATGEIAVPRGQWFHYKYTRGDWSVVEKWAGCLESDNRYTFGAAQPVKVDAVAEWADLCE